MKSPNVIVFDLDDTLYLEHDFAVGGFRAAAVWLQKETGIEGLEEICLARFNSGQRTKIFDDAIGQLDMTAGRDIVERLVGVYRNHSPDISLTDDFSQVFWQRAKEPPPCVDYRWSKLHSDGKGPQPWP